jgi:hypothetical protein
LKDRFEDGDPMRGVELATMRAWRDEEKPNAAWARRYGGDFPDIMEFLENSEWQQKKWAPLVLPAVCIAVLGAYGLLLAGIFSMLGHSEIPEVLEPLWSGGSLAIACAFGVWRYAGVGAKRAMLAALVGFVLAGGGPLLLPKDAILVGHPWVAATGVMIGLAAFAPSFRRIPVWLLFVVLFAVPISFTNWWARPPTSGLLAFAIMLLWLAALGHYLRGARLDGWSTRLLGRLRARPYRTIFAPIGRLRDRYRVPQHSRSA